MRIWRAASAGYDNEHDPDPVATGLVTGHGQRTLPLARACQREAGGGATSSARLVAARLASSRRPSWDGVPGSAA